MIDKMIKIKILSVAFLSLGLEHREVLVDIYQVSELGYEDREEKKGKKRGVREKPKVIPSDRYPFEACKGTRA